MKTVILAGGMGTRLQSATEVRPKPMIEIGGHPLLWHIMGGYAAAGFGEFILALGYKASYIKDYFLRMRELSGDLSVDLSTGEATVHAPATPPWRVHLVDTGVHTQTGGRLSRLRPWIGDAPFMLTYGDGLADVDLGALLAFHKAHGRLATVTAVRPPARFGALNLADGDLLVRRFDEKPHTEAGWINGGFFVLEPAALDLIPPGDDAIWERAPLERLAAAGQLAAFRHEGFWHPIDTPRDKAVAEALWEAGDPPWMRGR